MSSTYTVNIKIDDANALKKAGFKLHAFRAVQSKSPGGKPVVWIMRDDYGNDETISWVEEYGAYVSNQAIQAGAVISSRDDRDIDIGQTMIRENDKSVSISKEGQTGTITISNDASDDCFCGISEKKDTKYNPICVFSLAHGFSDLITPISKIALMWASTTIETATVIEKAVGPGILVDLSAANTRTVSYNYGKAVWTADEQGKAEAFGSRSPLSPLLINPAV